MSDHDRNLCESCLEAEYDAFAHDLIHKSMAQNEVWLKKYKINDWPRWDYSLEEGTLTFSRDGKAQVICEIEAVGSVEGDSWEWTWGNSNLPDACRSRMHKVREFGEEKEWSKLTSLFLANDDYLGWELASVSVHLLGGIAAYRCPDSEAPGYFMYVAVLSSRFVQ